MIHQCSCRWSLTAHAPNASPSSRVPIDSPLRRPRNRWQALRNRLDHASYAAGPLVLADCHRSSLGGSRSPPILADQAQRAGKTPPVTLGAGVSAYPGFRRVYGDAGAVLARRATGRKARRSSRAPLSAEERAAIRKAGADDARRSRVRQGLPDRIDDAAVIAVLADLLRTARSTPHPGTSQERKRRPEPHKRRAAEDIPRRSSSPRGRSGVASTAARVRCPVSNLP